MEGLAVKAPWPIADAEDKLLTRQSKFLSSSIKTFRAQVGKAKKGWKNSVILVTNSYPDWKVEVLKWMQGQHDGSAFPSTFMKDIKDWTGASFSDKKLIKFAMQFASFIKKEVEDVGAPAMELSLPFNQKAILEESSLYLKAQLGLTEVCILVLDEMDAAKDVPDRIIENVSPGKPFLWLH
jgi:leucyl-tRNA synthetase